MAMNIELSEGSEEQISFSTSLPPTLLKLACVAWRFWLGALSNKGGREPPCYAGYFKTGKWNLGNLWNTPVKTVMLRNNESQEEKISWSERMFLFFSLFPSSPRAFYFFRFLLFLEGYPAGASAEGRAFQPHLSSEEKRKVSQGLFTSSTKPSLYTDVVFFFFSFFSSVRKKK